MISDVSERDPVEVLAEEFMDRQRRKERVTVEEYAQRFPDLADRIRSVFPALQLLEEFKPEVSDDRQTPALLKQLGEFRIIRFLGRGGMGVVYEAIQETLDRRVALKVLPADLARDPDFRTRFHREARMAAQLHHPNIVAVHGAGQTEGMHFLVMELIEGASLDGVLESLTRRATGQMSQSQLKPGTVRWEQNGTATPPAMPLFLADTYRENRPAYYRCVADIIARCADALAYAHGNGVIHRDIKPGNILLARHEQTPDRIEPKITDFGLAKAEGAGDLTRSGFVVGTPRYVAPERFNGEDSPFGDVFALGATMFELLTLQHAFDAPTRERLIDVIHRNDPRRPRDLVADVPNDLEIITQKALAKNPQQRYTAAGLADDLRRWLDGRPILARRVGPMEKLVAWSRRNPVVAGLTAGLFLTLSTGLIISLLLWRTAETNRIAAQTNFEKADAEFHRAEDNAREVLRQKEEVEKALGQSLSALDEFYRRVSEEKLLNVPGLQPLRRDLLVSALNYYQGFSQQHQNDPRLRRETARALLNAGRIQGIIGTRDESRPLLERSHQAYAELAKEFPDDVEVRRGLCRACEHLAVIRYSMNQLPAARALYLEAAKQGKHIGDANGRYWQAWCIIRAADVAKDQGNMQQAFAELPTARAILEQLIQENEMTENCQYALWRADVAASASHRRQGSAEALKFAEDSLTRIRQLLENHPDDPEYRRSLARSLVQTAMCEFPLKKVDQAKSHFAEGRAVLMKLFQENPTVHDYEIAIASSLRQEGQQERGARNLDRARELLAESLVIYERNHARDANDLACAKSLAEVLSELSLTYAAQGLRNEALPLALRAGQAYQYMVERSPDTPAFRCYAGQGFSNYANLLNLRGEYEKALAPVRQAIVFQREAVAAGKRAPTFAARYLIQHYIVLWTALRKLDRWSDHDAAMQEYLLHHAGNGVALVRAAHEYCDCITEQTDFVGPPSEQQIERMRYATGQALDLLREAAAKDIDGARKEFRAPNFRALRGQSGFRDVLDKFKNDL